MCRQWTSANRCVFGNDDPLFGDDNDDDNWGGLFVSSNDDVGCLFGSSDMGSHNNDNPLLGHVALKGDDDGGSGGARAGASLLRNEFKLMSSLLLVGRGGGGC